MKSYILRDRKAVEPQNSFRPLREDPAVLATVEAILGRPAATDKGPVLFIGLDVHNDSIAVARDAGENSEPRALIFTGHGSKRKGQGGQVRRARSTSDSFGAPPPLPPPAKAILVR